MADPNKQPLTQSMSPPPPGSVTISGAAWSVCEPFGGPPPCNPVLAPPLMPQTIPSDGSLAWRNFGPPSVATIVLGHFGLGFSLQFADVSGNGTSQWVLLTASMDPTGTYTATDPCTVPSSLVCVYNP